MKIPSLWYRYCTIVIIHVYEIIPCLECVIVSIVQELGLPDSLKEKSEQEHSNDIPVCDICKESHDSHLMALCDTCNMHYHIGCLDPPLSRVPKKSAKWGWSVGCLFCLVDSEK